MDDKVLFKMLGFDDKMRHYFETKNGDVVRIAFAPAYRKKLFSLAPVEFWKKHFYDKYKLFDFQSVASWMINESNKVGKYHWENKKIRSVLSSGKVV